MRILICCLAAGLSLAVSPCSGQEAPDKSLRVEVHRGDQAGDCIEILASSGSLRYRESADDARHLVVERTAWTADSQFFVWSGINAVGHQPWHHPIFFWSRKSNSVEALEDYLPGLVTEADFSLSPPAIVEGVARRDFNHSVQHFRLALPHLSPAGHGTDRRRRPPDRPPTAKDR